MELYREIHGNDEFFQGYQDRVDFLREMTAQVKQEFSDSQTELENQSRHSEHTEFEEAHIEAASNQLVPFVDLVDLTEKAFRAKNVRDWKN